MQIIVGFILCFLMFWFGYWAYSSGRDDVIKLALKGDYVYISNKKYEVTVTELQAEETKIQGEKDPISIVKMMFQNEISAAKNYGEHEYAERLEAFLPSVVSFLNDPNVSTCNNGL